MVATIVLATEASADVMSWNFASATPSSAAIPNLIQPTVTSYNNNGTTTLLTTTSASTGYAGASGTNNAGAASRTGTINTAASGSAALQFTLEPSAGYQVELSAISFGSRSTSTGPAAYSLRSSADGYTTDIATGTLATSSSWALKSNAGLSFSSSSAVTLRLFGHSGAGSPGANTANWRIDDLSLTLTVTSVGPDTTAPLVTSFAPVNAATNAPLGSNLTATFNESVTAIAGGTVTIKRADNSTFEEFILPSSKVQTGGAVIINPTTDLEPGITYYVEISEDAFEDAAGNNFFGFAGNATWGFSTPVPDVTGPAIASYVPALASSVAHPLANLQLTFDEPLTALSGNIEIFKSDNSPVETLAIGSPQVIISGTTLTINPTAPLEFETGYYVNLPAGAVEDAVGNDNLPVTGGSGWNFTTRLAPKVVISQTYEGTTTANHFIELKNLTGGTVTLTDYRLAVWSDTAPSDNEGWKSGTGTTTRVISLAGKSIPPNGYLLVSHSDSVTPAYAAANSDIKDSGFNVATFFDGDDSVVLYDGATNALDNIADAVSVSANNAVDISLYRVSDEPLGYDFAPASSVFAYPTVWATKPLLDVASALPEEAWYLRASQDPKTLTLTFDVASVNEGAGANAATATVTRTGSTTAELFFNISVSAASEIEVTTPASIPADEATATFPLTALNDSLPDGNRVVTITVQADGYVPGSAQITVNDDGLDPAFNVVINEVDADQTGTDTNEFIELYNKSATPQSLNGLVLVLYNGSGDTSYNVIDLSGYSIPANDYFVIGSPTVPNVDLEKFVLGNGIENGADAIILCFGAPADFPTGTATVSGSLVVDAIVYGTDDADDAELIAGLNPGKPQVDEGATAIAAAKSMSRVPNGGAAFATALFVAQTPTPGTTNILATDFDTWAGETGATGGMTGDTDFDGRDNAFEYAFGLNPTSGGSVNPFTVPFSKTSGQFTFTRRNPSSTGLTYTYQYHTTLTGAWTAFTPDGSPTIVGDPVQAVTVTVPAALLTEPKLFIRIVTTP